MGQGAYRESRVLGKPHHLLPETSLFHPRVGSAFKADESSSMEKNRLENVSAPRASEEVAGMREGTNRCASLIWGPKKDQSNSRSQGVVLKV